MRRRPLIDYAECLPPGIDFRAQRDADSYAERLWRVRVRMRWSRRPFPANVLEFKSRAKSR